ncbi:Aspartyl protease apcb1 [Thalictrum thalictroides]|uniref:Aspartyl protease apcb1 n=1 Tax=Thalictrum thalictroides TaxID=46969 RepID=A0A7J6WUH8_THATH|nr:Aspartyl protease apcb1 [Thalictrum thalictroides]
MSSSSGVLGEDIVFFGNGSALEPQRAVFGCENEETGDLYSQHADGIMGLGRGQLSILDQLVDKGVIGDSFSLCYGGMGVGGGAMVLGGITPPTDMVYSHSNPVRSPYYNIELKELHVAGKPLKLKPEIFNGKHGTVLDSGTTYAYLPEAAFLAFKDAIMKNLNHLKQIRGPDPNYNDICFSGAGSVVAELSKTFPAVDMVFDGGNKLSLAPENYLFRHSKVHGAYCLGIFQNGKDPTTLLGGIVVRNTLVTYDRENEKVGFFKTNCSVLWDNVHIVGANSTKPSSTRNSTIGVSPTMAPTGLPVTDKHPGKFKIGIITFDMLLGMKYSDFVPHMGELRDFIAHELDVNTSQVHLLNYTGTGNETAVSYCIYPKGSAYYISNTTAMNIIDSFTEHRFTLPGTYGKYQLVAWKVEPPLKRSWWKIYLWAVLGGIAALALCIASFGLWYLWRQRQQAMVALGTYKPVAVVVPEQELQEL